MGDALPPRVPVVPRLPVCPPAGFLTPSAASARQSHLRRYLKPGGLIFPNKATMYVAAIEDEEYKHNKIECERREEDPGRAMRSG